MSESAFKANTEVT